MEFCWTTLTVKNLDISIHFYSEIIGLPLARRFKPNEQMEIAFLGTGSTELELVQVMNDSDMAFTGEGISVGFISKEKLEVIIDQLIQAGYNEQSEVYAPNPDMRFFKVKDPDGFSVQIVEDKRTI